MRTLLDEIRDHGAPLPTALIWRRNTVTRREYEQMRYEARRAEAKRRDDMRHDLMAEEGRWR